MTLTEAVVIIVSCYVTAHHHHMAWRINKRLEIIERMLDKESRG